MKVDFGVELAAVDSTDLEQIRQWRNDHLIWKFCRQNDLISDVDQKAWFDRQSADPTVKNYKIMRRVAGQRVAVGVCGFSGIDLLNRRAEFGIYIGPEFHRQGYGREGLKLLLHHGFLNLGLMQIWGETFEGNPAAQLFESLGFIKDGTRRAFYFRDGRFIDAHLYSIMVTEWITGLQASSASSSAAPSPSTSGRQGATGAHSEPLSSGPLANVRSLPKGRGRRQKGSPSPSPTNEPG